MAMTIDDPRLIESFRAGENDAFEALVRAHRPALYRHALRKLSDHAAAEDAVQETFMRAYKSRTRVNDDWQLRPWLHQICANVCIDEANRRRKESVKTSRWAIVDMPTRGIAPELEKELGLDADHSEMTAAILSLPANYQEALSMRYVEELEYDEIAEILDISEQNARARVSRASKAVRVLLRPVAAIIAFLAVIFGRRAPKAAMAATADPTTAATAATTATHTATAATQVAQTATASAHRNCAGRRRCGTGRGAHVVEGRYRRDHDRGRHRAGHRTCGDRSDSPHQVGSRHRGTGRHRYCRYGRTRRDRQADR